MSQGLPRGWVTARLGDLALEVRNGIATKPDAERGTPILRISAVRPMALNAADIRFLAGPTSVWEQYRLREDDLLFTRYNGNPSLVGVCGRVLSRGADLLVYPDKLIRVRLHSELALPAFVEKAVHVGASRAFIGAKTKTSAGQVGISGADLKEVPIPVAPLNEQRRIVAKLESLQARSRRARAALDAVPPLLEQLRQSILAAAFRGDLTKDWRAKRTDVEPARELISRTAEPSGKSSGRAASTSVRPGLGAISVGDPDTPAPGGWHWVPLSRVARMESGHTPSRNHAEYWDGGIPWIGIQDARDGHGKEIHTTAQTVSELGLANSSARLLPARTVCLSRTASVGYVTIMGKPMATSQDFADWICTPALLPEFLMYALLAEGEHIKTFGEGSTHTTIYFPELKAFHVCLAPLEEQREIVRRVQTLLDRIEHLRLNAAERLAQLTVLDRSTLAKAFRGELVPQDPNDEPADVVLARSSSTTLGGRTRQSSAKDDAGDARP